jgi:dUTP pyrophosphatase
MKVKINSLSGIYPSYETEGSAGMDLRAWLSETVVLEPGDIKLIPTGLFMEFEPGYEVQLRARSGLAVKHGIGLVNGVGTIDSDYRGEIKVALINQGKEAFAVGNGDRIAQMVIAPVARAEIVPVETLSQTERGSGGFGSTGV